MAKRTKILLFSASLLLVLAASLLYFTSAVFLQLFIAFALAYLLNPTVELLERNGVKRVYGIMIVFCLAVLLCSGIAVFFAVSITGEFTDMPFIIENTISKISYITEPSLEDYIKTDHETRIITSEFIQT